MRLQQNINNMRNKCKRLHKIELYIYLNLDGVQFQIKIISPYRAADFVLLFKEESFTERVIFNVCIRITTT